MDLNRLKKLKELGEEVDTEIFRMEERKGLHNSKPWICPIIWHYLPPQQEVKITYTRGYGSNFVTITIDEHNQWFSGTELGVISTIRGNLPEKRDLSRRGWIKGTVSWLREREKNKRKRNLTRKGHIW